MHRTNAFARGGRVLRKVLATVSVMAAAGTLVAVSYTVKKQQDTISTLLAIAELDAQMAYDHERKLWDLHRRVTALDDEDERLMAYIRWFVMRRSGTAELRRMERAIERLEAAE